MQSRSDCRCILSVGTDQNLCFIQYEWGGSALCRKIYSICLTMASLINNTGKSSPTAVICSGRGLLYYIAVIFFQYIRFFFRALLSKSFGSMFHSHQVSLHQTPGQKALLRLLLPLSLSPMYLTKLPFYFLLHLF